MLELFVIEANLSLLITQDAALVYVHLFIRPSLTFGSRMEVSERRACSTLGTDGMSVRYRSTRPDDAALRARLRELAPFAVASVTVASISS